MGLIANAIYLDTCIVIYLVEEHLLFGKHIQRVISENELKKFCHSPLVEMECLVGPIKLQNAALRERYEAFFRQLTRLDITPAIYREAAILRARFGLKTPDALHLATAHHYSCASLWTNDDRLADVAEGFAFNVLAEVKSGG